MIAASLHLAWRYVTRHRVQSVLLAASLGLVLALPLTIETLSHATEQTMQQRARSTPQLLGAKGSALDLLLTALYFKKQPLPTIPASLLDQVRATQLGQAIPLYIRFHAQDSPIVGTELEYFSFRGLTITAGHMLSRLGDCVIGARLAQTRHLKPGDSLFSTQEQVFDLAGIYPLKMHIRGVLSANGTPDDDAIFVDLKTTRVIEGIAHGHEDLVANPVADTVLAKEKSNVIANASVRMFNEITDHNFASFHFHGDEGSYPLSAILIIPQDVKAEAILAGRYLKADSPAQLIRPSDEFNNLLGTLFQMEAFALLLLAVLALAALSVASLVFTLSFRLRQREFVTLADIGVSSSALSLTKAFEIVIIGAAAILIALALQATAALNAGSLIHWFLR